MAVVAYCIIGFLQVVRIIRSPNLVGWVYARLQDQRDSKVKPMLLVERTNPGRKEFVVVHARVQSM